MDKLQANVINEKNTELPIKCAKYVSEHTEYHHGEASLKATLVHMASKLVGRTVD
jgi:DNA gyrase/topoisomerase IV subunit A